MLVKEEEQEMGVQHAAHCSFPMLKGVISGESSGMGIQGMGQLNSEY